ncbi:MAG: putative membrane protein YdjX (TVP38/TMEM64 family) [Bradymonadia bacterium]|jgi:uncharacterized membrane protein YdjX (TVP38/TMEM64 family)
MFLAFRYTPLGELFTEARVSEIVEGLGMGAAPVWILTYAVLIALWVPGTPLTLIGAAVFGPIAAIPLNYAGAVLGSALGHSIARVVGGDSLQKLLSARFPKFEGYQRILERRGFEAVLYLRLVPTPYTLISWLGGLSPVGLGRFSAATAIGILPGSISFTYLLGMGVEFARTKDTGLFFEPYTLGAVGLYAFALSIPAILAVARRRWGWFSAVAEATEATDEPV